MIQEFIHAEKRLMTAIRQGVIQHEFPILSIPDVFGLKLITEPHQLNTLLKAIQDSPDCRLIEQEHHTGRYNAINLRISYTLPKELLLNSPPSGPQLDVFEQRGISRDTILRDYVDFIESADDHVFLEVICSGYEEFLESEVGRSMHEDRIIRQRRDLEYDSGLANNVTYLMEYILSLCLAPSQDEVTDVPIKLWVKYMPDTFERLLRRLFRIPVDSSFDAMPATVFGSPPIPSVLTGDGADAAGSQN